MKHRSLQTSHWRWKTLAFLYCAVFLTILILAYTGNLPPVLTGNDKLGHVVLYGIATYLGHQVLHRRQINLFDRQLPLFPFLFGVFTVVEELLQSLSPNRTLDVIDIIASFVGILLGYWLAERENNKK